MTGFDGFNAAEVEPSEEAYDLIPNGNYRCGIVGCERKHTRQGTGEYIAVRLDILDGPMKGRKLFHNINFINKNPDATRIGCAELSSLCRAVGIMTPQDCNEFINKIVNVKVTTKKNKKSGEMENRIDYPDGSKKSNSSTQHPTTQQPQQPQGGAAGVWQS